MRDKKSYRSSVARTITIVGAALAALGVVAATALSEGTGRGDVGSEREFDRRASHGVGAPADRTQLRAGSGPKLAYVETDVFNIPANGADDSSVRCPRRYKALSGYFGTDGGIVLDFSSVGANQQGGLVPRRWDFGLVNLVDAPGQAYFGIVCIKGIGLG